VERADNAIDLAVWLQVRGADAAAGDAHLAAGVLLDTDVVLIPSPPDALLDPSLELEVVVIPIPLALERAVERIRPARIDVLYLGGPEAPPSSAVIKLASPSRHPIMVAEYDGCDLNQSLAESGGDMWSSLERVGAIPAGLRDGPPVEVLQGLAEVELVQRRPVRRKWVLGLPSGDDGPSPYWPLPCWLSPRCEPCDPGNQP
jgi:hypothetical protein